MDGGMGVYVGVCALFKVRLCGDGISVGRVYGMMNTHCMVFKNVRVFY